MVLKLVKPWVLEEGSRFTLRDGAQTVGTGVVTKVLPKLSEIERQQLMEGKKSREKRIAAAAGGK